MYLVYSSHVITPLVNSSMYSYVMHRQVKGMVTLNLFIESPLQIHCIRYMRKAHPYSSLVHKLTAEHSPLLAAAAITQMCII